MVQHPASTTDLDLLAIRSRVDKTLANGLQFDMSTEACKKLLKRNVNTKADLIIMFIDINGSTELSLSLPDNKFTLMVQCFAQEISNLISAYGGYVFKYEGDAVITLFPAMYDDMLACKNALNCSITILDLITKVINPAFTVHDLPEITVKIGLAYGKASIVLYGKNLEKSHIDIIGPSISMASKIMSVARPNQVLVGESIYNILQSSDRSSDFLKTKRFTEVVLDPIKWKYISRSDPESAYRVYEVLEN
jgi:adenylate cyclase